MIEIYAGKPGTGKSLKLADQICELLARNEKWFVKTGQLRKICSNLKIAKHVEEMYPNFIEYWENVHDLVHKRDCDIIWDEIATELDSTHWKDVPRSMKRFLQQHRKRGIDIYGSTQNFAMIDISMRRLVDNLWICHKIFGSRNPSPTKPPIEKIWGMIWLKEVDADTFEDEKPKTTGWDWLWITRKLVNVYDTKQEILLGENMPYQHIPRRCELKDCDFEKILHI